ncbi:cell division protein ZipA [Thalassotalea maritima]|uniref:cell division protein ZipA n=1 Tax=Thalassotalea maritima TaxID=3242416 RepID=UPI0035288379
MEISLRDILIIISVIVVIAIFLNGRQKIRRDGKNPLKLEPTSAEGVDALSIERNFDRDGFDQDGVGIPKPVIGHEATPAPSVQSNREPASPEAHGSAEGVLVGVSSVDKVEIHTSRTNHDELLSDPDVDHALRHTADSDEALLPEQQLSFSAVEQDDIIDTVHTFEQAGLSNQEQSRPAQQHSPELNQTQHRKSHDDTTDIRHHSGENNAVEPNPPTAERRGQEHNTPTPAPKRDQMEIDFDDSKSAQPVEQEVLALSVVMPDSQVMMGATMLPCFLTLGLKFGEMNIFHRHEDNAGNGRITFSVANMVNPGTFDLDNMEHFTTRGVTLFMTLPNARDPQTVFKQMLTAAKHLANELGGQVLDGQRSVMTRQTEQHYISRIREFDRRARLAGA